jgi:peroxiredoxin
MERVYRDYQGDGLIILAVNATNQDSAVAAQTFASEHELTFPILLDNHGEVSDLYQLRAMPTTYFIDKMGIIQEIVTGGPMAEALLRVRVEDLLMEAP